MPRFNNFAIKSSLLNLPFSDYSLNKTANPQNLLEKKSFFLNNLKSPTKKYK